MSAHEAPTFRRKYPRRAFRRMVSVLHEGAYHLAHAVEIGEGGMAVDVPLALAPGDQIVVNFQIPAGDFVSLRAEVRAGEGTACGVEFKNIRFGQKRQIRTYVSARSDSDSIIL